MLQRTEELCSVESGSLFAESALVLQVVEQLASICVRQAKIQLVCCLEGEFETKV